MTDAAPPTEPGTYWAQPVHIRPPQPWRPMRVCYDPDEPGTLFAYNFGSATPWELEELNWGASVEYANSPNREPDAAPRTPAVDRTKLPPGWELLRPWDGCYRPPSTQRTVADAWAMYDREHAQSTPADRTIPPWPFFVDDSHSVDVGYCACLGKTSVRLGCYPTLDEAIAACWIVVDNIVREHGALHQGSGPSHCAQKIMLAITRAQNDAHRDRIVELERERDALADRVRAVISRLRGYSNAPGGHSLGTEIIKKRMGEVADELDEALSPEDPHG